MAFTAGVQGRGKPAFAAIPDGRRNSLANPPRVATRTGFLDSCDYSSRGTDDLWRGVPCVSVLAVRHSVVTPFPTILLEIAWYSNAR